MGGDDGIVSIICIYLKYTLSIYTAIRRVLLYNMIKILSRVTESQKVLAQLL